MYLNCLKKYFSRTLKLSSNLQTFHKYSLSKIDSNYKTTTRKNFRGKNKSRNMEIAKGRYQNTIEPAIYSQLFELDDIFTPPLFMIVSVEMSHDLSTARVFWETNTFENIDIIRDKLKEYRDKFEKLLPTKHFLTKTPKVIFLHSSMNKKIQLEEAYKQIGGSED